MAIQSLTKPIEIGQRFTRLVVLGQGKKDRFQYIWTRCQCDCGTVLDVRGTHLRKGKTRSCGCLRREITRQNKTIHSQTKKGTVTPEYHAWLSMKKRVLDPSSHCFHRYGGRGITICEGWLNSSVTFLTDMGRRPSPQHTVERRNNNGHYSCGHCKECKTKGWVANCRWATQKEQANNRSTNHFLTYEEQTKTIQQWEDYLRFPQGLIGKRLHRGWPVKRTLTTPVRHYP